jgi:hypothetical protein
MSVYAEYRWRLLLLPAILVALVVLAHNLLSNLGMVRFVLKLFAIPVYLGFRFVNAPTGTLEERKRFDAYDLLMLGTLTAGVAAYSQSTGFLPSTEVLTLTVVSVLSFAAGAWLWGGVRKPGAEGQ